jgi:MFS family permease
MILFGMLRGAAWGLYFIAIVTVINKRTPPEMASTFLSILNAGAMGIAPLISSPVAGFIYDLLGPVYVFITGGILCSLAVIILLIGSRRSDQSIHNPT